MLGASDSLRVELANQAVLRLIHSPLLGDMFTPFSAVRAGGQLADFERIFPSHNQYLDLGLRGGLLVSVAYAALIFVTLRATWRATRANSDFAGSQCFQSAILGVGVVAAVSSPTSLVFVTTWSGLLVGLLLGVNGYEHRDVPKSRGAESSCCAFRAAPFGPATGRWRGHDTMNTSQLGPTPFAANVATHEPCTIPRRNKEARLLQFTIRWVHSVGEAARQQFEMRGGSGAASGRERTGIRSLWRDSADRSRPQVLHSGYANVRTHAGSYRG